MVQRRPLWRRILLTFVIPLAILAVGACILYPRWCLRVMLENERSAQAALGMLATAEADFRANDRDGNGINDFWTADVAELSRLKLLPKEVGLADGSPRSPLAPKPVPYRGYYFEAMEVDYSIVPPEPYAQDTDKKSGKVHHLRNFGFVAYPVVPGVTGRAVFIINENNGVRYTLDATRKPQGWPSDTELMMQWYRNCGG